MSVPRPQGLIEGSGQRGDGKRMSKGQGTAQRLRELITDVMRLDREWMSRPDGRDNAQCTPWMPFPLFDFIALVAEALPETTGSAFLEVGCGIGTRMLVAHELYGLDCHGIDRVPEYVAQVSKRLPGAPGGPAVTAEVADALSWEGYGDYDLVWFNRPFNDAALQRQLEARVWEAMRPGAVVIAANLLSPPPGGWWPVLDDPEVRRWIRQKP